MPPATNSNLLGPLVTQQFSSTSYRGGRTFAVPSGAASNAFIAKTNPELQVTYSAETNTYTLTTAGAAQSFGPGDLSSEGVNTRYFTRDNGAGTKDWLWLTKPGTSGLFNMTYVGGGLWLREVDEGTQLKGVANVFTYGIETADAAVPRIGHALFEVGLSGHSGTKEYAGAGVLTADFLSGGFITNVTVAELVLDTSVVTNGFAFVGSGDISGTSNLFSGTFSLNTVEKYWGKLDGRFYGPSSEEVGVAFAGFGTPAGEGMSGYMVGRRKSPLVGKNVSVKNLFTNESFTTRQVEPSYTTSIATGAYIDGIGVTRRSGPVLSYQAGTGGYTIFGQPVFLPSEKAASGDARYSIYDHGDGNRLFLYTPGTDNPDLQLTYASFAVLETVTLDAGADRKTTRQTYTPFGIAATNMPTFGSATYAGKVYGTGTSASAVYELTGDASLNVNFLTSTLTGQISPDGRNLANDTIVDFGVFGVDTTGLNANGTFMGSIDFATFGAISNFSGALYGHAGKEFGAVFTGIEGTDPAFAANPVTLSGVAVGRVN